MSEEQCWRVDLQRILRVNQSGEYGAIGIYQSQIVLAQLVWKKGVPLLQEMLAQERKHLAIFSSLLKDRRIRSCYALPLWRLGGWLLGSIACLYGRRGILICTTAVETSVLQHLVEQRETIGNRDPELLNAIAMIEREEREHRDYGLDVANLPGFASWFIRRLASDSTKFAIWLSMHF